MQQFSFKIKYKLFVLLIKMKKKQFNMIKEILSANYVMFNIVHLKTFANRY